VKTEVLRLLAITRGHAGRRAVAAMFNARFAFRGESVSKTYVAELRKKSGYEISQLRKILRQPPKPGKLNQTWALDWTHVKIASETHALLGVIDHGSRRLLTLCFADRSANTVLSVLNRLTRTFGKPKALRTDNDGALVSMYFALAIRRLRIKHQRTPPHSPWANGRIERFFGTFKRAIRQIEIDSKARLEQAIDLNKPSANSRFSTTTFGCIKIWAIARRIWRGAASSSFQNEKTRDGLRAGAAFCLAGIGVR